MVTFPPEMCIKIEDNSILDANRESRSLMQLADKVFPDLKNNIRDPSWLNGRYSIFYGFNINTDQFAHSYPNVGLLLLPIKIHILRNPSIKGGANNNDQ